MKRCLLILILGFSTSSWACLSLPRDVALTNSPFFFNNFSISGYNLQIPFAGGDQMVTFTCKHEGGHSYMQIEAGDNTSTPENDPFPRTQVTRYELNDRGQPKLDANGEMVLTRFQDDQEVPLRTGITNFRDGAGAASFEIESEGSQNKMRVTCSESGGVTQFEAAFLDSTGTPIFSVSAAHNGLTRGLGAPQRAPDATIDMANLTEGVAQFAGCGGATLPLTGTGGGTGVEVAN